MHRILILYDSYNGDSHAESLTFETLFNARCKNKGKSVPVQATKAYMESGTATTPSLKSLLNVGDWSASRPSRHSPWEVSPLLTG